MPSISLFTSIYEPEISARDGRAVGGIPRNGTGLVRSLASCCCRSHITHTTGNRLTHAANPDRHTLAFCVAAPDPHFCFVCGSQNAGHCIFQDLFCVGDKINLEKHRAAAKPTRRRRCHKCEEKHPPQANFREQETGNLGCGSSKNLYSLTSASYESEPPVGHCELRKSNKI